MTTMVAEALSDGALLREGLAGDASAFDALVNRYDGLLRHVAASYRLGEDAGDAVQAAWLALLLHGHGLREPEAVRGWLVVTVRRECLRLLRRRGREQLCAGAERDWELLTDVAMELSVDEAVVRAEEAVIVRDAVATLPPRLQVLMDLLQDPDNGGYAEVSARLEMPVGSIGPTRQRTLKRLRSKVMERGLTRA